MRNASFFLLGATFALAATACSDDDGRGPRPDTGVIGVDGGATDDGGPAADGATPSDASPPGDGAPAVDGGPAPDGATPDGGPSTDAGPTTPCGTETCNRATEVCVSGSFGGPSIIECRAVPTSCESNRTCACLASAYCNTGLAVCTDVSDNHIDCDTGLD